MQLSRLVAAVFALGTVVLVVAIYERGLGVAMNDPQQLFVVGVVAVALVGLAALAYEFLPLLSE